jgi:hypothetical protein
MRFSAYNLSIESELTLPELLPCLNAGLPDVHILIGSVNDDGIPNGQQLGPFL